MIERNFFGCKGNLDISFYCLEGKINIKKGENICLIYLVVKIDFYLGWIVYGFE